MNTASVTAICLFIVMIISFRAVKAKPYYSGVTLCETLHATGSPNCVNFCTEKGYSNGFCKSGTCYCALVKNRVTNVGTFCDNETELQCAAQCQISGFSAGNCQQNKVCVCSFLPKEQDPICTMGGNLTCHMHCYDLAYPSGYCDSLYDCCCSYGIIDGDCVLLKDPSQDCLSEERTVCEKHCKSQGYETFICRNKQCLCPASAV